jgi:hypothetical protein
MPIQPTQGDHDSTSFDSNLSLPQLQRNSCVKSLDVRDAPQDGDGDGSGHGSLPVLPIDSRAELPPEVALLLETMDREENRRKEMAELQFQELMNSQDKERQKMLKTIEFMVSKFQERLIEAKTKHWCTVCLKEATLYCCWTGSYCNATCQTKHWMEGHKRVCTRKRRESVNS